MPQTQGTGRWLSNISIRAKLLLAFGVLLALFLVSALAFFNAQQRQAETRMWTIHTYEVINQLEQLRASVYEQQANLRGYEITLDQQFLPAYHKAGADADRLFASLLRLTADNAAQQPRLSQMQDTIRRWRADVAEPALALKSEQLPTRIALTRTGKGLVDGFHDVLRATQAEEQNLLVQRTAALDAAVRQLRALSVGVGVLGLLTVIFAMLMVQRLIVDPLTQITGLMSRLADRDNAIVVPNLQRGDEIGALARVLNVFRGLSIDTQRLNWVKTVASSISATLQAQTTEPAFAEQLCNLVAPELGAGVAVFYQADESGEHLRLLGSYGYRQRKHLSTHYRVGEGLVGQCARERKPITLQPVPEDYVHIHSGLGDAPPRLILVLPVMSRQRLCGVLELGSFAPFTAAQNQLLEELLPLAALSLDNLGRALKTQQLLEESQAQAEELQASEEALTAQQEELRLTNETLAARTNELQRQSEQLRASEEELRSQSEELQASNEEMRENSKLLQRQKIILENLQMETQQKADELARASQYKSEFLANMSHELRTPLNSLLILARGLADNELGHLDAEEVESAQVIHAAGSNLLRLINDILDLSKVEAGKMDVVVEEVRLTSLAASLTRNFRHVAKEKDVALVVDLAEGAPESIRTDGAKLEQICNNLLSNAFKFTAKGQVHVHIAPVPAGTQYAVSITVSDTGIGIPEDKLQKVFQAFEQVDASTSRHYGGTGLGLSISRGLTQLLGGKLGLESAVGQGSSFTLLLPAELTPRVEQPAAPKPAPAPVTTSVSTPALIDDPEPAEPQLPFFDVPDDRKSITGKDTVILVIEDDPAFARILVDMIRRKGFRALACGNGETGLRLAREYKPTGILLDVMLPGVDGWSVIEQLKAEPRTAHIPVHFISALDEHLRGRDLGAVGFLTKPVTRDALAAAFERLLHFAEGSTRRVLVVDDDSSSRFAIKKLIAGKHIEIFEAGTGQAALQVLEEQQIDCIVLDLGLPDIDGFEFLEAASLKSEVPPVVVYSGRELSEEETLKLRHYTDSIVIKGARSPERLLAEVSLFLHSIPPEGESLRAPVSDSTLQGRHALIVDDDIRNVFALSKLLRSKGLEVQMAQDGPKALNQLQEHPEIEIVLMDIMMPGMDGYQTMRAIRAEERYRQLPIIALTAKAMQGDREKCLEAGANDYLSKPIDIDKLLSMMRVYLKR